MISKNKAQVDVHGLEDPNHDIRYLGKATQMDDGTWRCLACVSGALCLVEVRITPKNRDPVSSAFCCSFCGKLESECGALVIGPAVNICDGCVNDARICISEMKSKAPVEFVRHIPTEAPCETCYHLLSASSIAPWWLGVCKEGQTLKQEIRNCHLYLPAEWKNKTFPGKK